MTKKKSEIEIRIATTDDAAHIALLGRITFQETFGHLFNDEQDLLDYYDATFAVDKIENSFSKPNNVYWIAFVDRLPVGYAKLKLNSKSAFISDSAICQLQKIYVLKDFLAMKIGYALQNLLLDKVKTEGFNQVWLSVLHTNERAIRFYLKNGFQKIGTHDFQIGKENFNFIAMSKHFS